MLHCKSCGKRVMSGDRFCSNCGVSTVTSERYVSNCNSDVSTENAFYYFGTPGSASASRYINDNNPTMGINTIPVAQPINQQYDSPSPLAYYSAVIQPYSYQPAQQTLPVKPNNQIVSKPKVARYSPLTYIMYTVSLIYILLPFFPTYEISIPFYDELQGEITILDAIKLGDLGLGLKVIEGFHLFIFMFFIVAFILNVISLVCIITHKHRVFWLLLALSGIVSLIGTIVWLLEWAAIKALLRSNFITYLVAEIINPTGYLFIAVMTALFIIIFSFIKRRRSYNY